MRTSSVSLRFPQGQFAALHTRLLEDLSREAFGLLFGRMEKVGQDAVIKVVAARYPNPQDYEHQGMAHLGLRREYVYRLLVEMQQRGDVDTVIDVHTHPFCKSGVGFSGVDDHDEINFHRWLTTTLDDINYASIVLSQSDYAARLWKRRGYKSIAIPARIKTQTVGELWASAHDGEMDETQVQNATDPRTGFLARSVLALGLDTLRKIMHNQTIAIVGVGGLGSVIAENLVHSGFHHLHLIDPDKVEVTNLNRIVGAYHGDVAKNRLKVDVVKDHLQRINPKAQVYAHPTAIENTAVLPVLAQADWIIVGTDSHFSRFTAQQLALRYAVPLISAGANISVEAGQITDMSGEVIIARCGDGLCLNCLGRINPTAAIYRSKGLFLFAAVSGETF